LSRKRGGGALGKKKKGEERYYFLVVPGGPCDNLQINRGGQTGEPISFFREIAKR